MDLVSISKPARVVLIVSVALAGLVVGLDWVSSRKAGGAMDVTEIELFEEVSMPPIDVSAPVETETATFALG